MILLTLLQQVNLVFQGCLKFTVKLGLCHQYQERKRKQKSKTAPWTHKLLIRNGVICQDETSRGLKRCLAACGVVNDFSTVQCRLLDAGRNARRLNKKCNTLQIKWRKFDCSGTKNTSTRPLVIKQGYVYWWKPCLCPRAQKKNFAWRNLQQRVNIHQKKMFWGVFYLYRVWNPHSHLRNVKFRNIHQLEHSIVPAMEKNFQTVTEFFSMALLLVKHQEKGRKQLKNRK